MLDFLMISTRSRKNGLTEIYPKFVINKSNDLMIRGRDFYAIWDKDRGFWSLDEQDALRLIDLELDEYAKENSSRFEGNVKVLHMWDSESGMIDKWHKFCQRDLRDSYHILDEKLIFANTKVSKRDYASKALPYPLEEGSIEAYDRLMSVLYSPEERKKIEWAIGSIVSGDSKKLQKFMVLYGAAGTGKSTVLNIIQQLFEGYYSVFDAKALGSSNNSFALEAFKSNPLVAIQHDGDLSRIEDNTRLNSLVSHELMTVNEKFKSTYTSQFKCFLFMGTNRPVKITDAKSGLMRRLIDVSPTGDKLSIKEYRSLTKQVAFELGAIAYHCQQVYASNPNEYDDYVPLNMLGASNDFYNFMLDNYFIFVKEGGVSLKQGWEMYKQYCDDAKVSYPYSYRLFKEELKNYFKNYDERYTAEDGTRVRSYYSDLKLDKFEPQEEPKKEEPKGWLIFEKNKSRFDQEYEDCPAQYASQKETPSKKWDDVTTKLKDLDTSKLHYVRVPENHIVIDFDILDENGQKSFEKNLAAAQNWLPTYAELSKSGQGIHLHYIYNGDVSELSRLYDEHVEVKVFTGKSALRRKLTQCNDIPIVTINSGLPLKGDTKMVNLNVIQSEKGLRKQIKRNLNKEIHPATKPSCDFIFKILEDAYNSGMKYDVTDMRNAVLAFAAQSTNQAEYCVKLVNKMKFKSEEPSDNHDDGSPIVFYDVEVFPNLFIVNWKFRGPEHSVNRMINPTPNQIEDLIQYRLVGFNCRRYDNHILWARMIGYDNEALYTLSQRIVSDDKKGPKNCFFSEAYNLSYTDIYDFSSKKQSLKKFEIELGIHHQELGLPWDKPVPEDQWIKVAEYCDNDVLATEAVFEARYADFLAREILADLAGMTVNDTTNSLTTRIIFGKEKHPNLVYTDLSEEFPGYEYVDGKNMYRGEDVGRGGYVYANPGMYGRTITFDVASMHPSSIIALNLFGNYTDNFRELLNARLLIKHKDFEGAGKLMNGKLSKWLTNPDMAKALSGALKIAINSVYGLTAANFDNPFRDPRNKNNIVALRGALFMVNLKHEIQNRGYNVVHIKTDSIKIENPSDDIFNFVMEYGKKYGYNFEVEHIFEKICLVNDAVYIAKLAEDDPEDPGKWTATGAQFQQPYLFKTLFSKEPIEFADVCETKEVKTALYLDMNENLPEGEHNYQFVGKIGSFCPVKRGYSGGELLREKDGKYSYATGAKGYRWLESETVKILMDYKECVDYEYYRKLIDAAVADISQYGDYEWFIT